MTVSAKSASESHADHRHWKSEIANWTDDIESWNKEHGNALNALEQITECVRHHGASLKEHANSLEQLSNSMEFHEKNLAASLQGGGNAELDESLAERHLQQSEMHRHQKDVHERMKKHHHQVMTQVAILKSAIESAF